MINYKKLKKLKRMIKMIKIKRIANQEHNKKINTMNKHIPDKQQNICRAMDKFDMVNNSKVIYLLLKLQAIQVFMHLFQTSTNGCKKKEEIFLKDKLVSLLIEIYKKHLILFGDFKNISSFKYS